VQIDAARFKGYFIDGQALMRENPFASQEGALCKELNASSQELVIRAARASGEHLLIDPKVVGVDPWGIDARAQLGIARIAANPALASTKDVKPWLTEQAGG
jgi:hypothetical protein